MNLQIPTPCHENWSEMTAVEKGRFCSSCSKQVFDLTHAGKQEVLDFIQNYENGKPCVRVQSSILVQKKEKVEMLIRSETHFTAYFAYSLMLVFGTALFSCESESAERLQYLQTMTENSLQQVQDAQISLLDSLIKQEPLKIECNLTDEIGVAWEEGVTMGIPVDEVITVSPELGEIYVVEEIVEEQKPIQEEQIQTSERKSILGRIKHFFRHRNRKD